MSLYSWKTLPLLLSEVRGLHYMNIKKPIFEDGVKAYWIPKILVNEVEDSEVVILY